VALVFVLVTRSYRAGSYSEVVAAQITLVRGDITEQDAGDMPARWVIHTVGPVYTESEDRSELLAACYRESLRVADELGAQTVAFPAVSAGAYGWPLHDATHLALATVQNTPTRVREVRFVLFSTVVLDAFRAVY
jgi:O-acetyl-ADP-ribose deacetylase (regulator of RNase III)